GDGDHPLGGLLSLATLRHTGELLASRGSRWHLAGYGGDETVGVSRAYLRDLLGSRPGLVFRHLRTHRVLRRWSWRETLRALADSRSFSRWTADTATALRDRQLPGFGPQFGWGAAVKLPPWSTPLAADLVRERLLAASAAAPLANQRAQHRAVTAVRAAAHNVRQLAGVLEHAGVSLATPYLDDAVIDAAFAADLAERGDPTRYKPLLAEAMRPILPAEVRDRHTKGFFAAEGIDGLRRHRTLLVELCADLRLAQLGLVNAEALRAALLGPDPSGQTSMAVERTIATELWLRAAARSRPRTEKGLV
ncbi:MAG: asparagine synthase-related protein, partial [Micromonosporaceae bacterium]